MNRARVSALNRASSSVNRSRTSASPSIVFPIIQGLPTSGVMAMACQPVLWGKPSIPNIDQ